MSEQTTETVTSLFKNWRAGDAESGQLLAQRVSDWFYAVCSSKYGETQGHAMFQSVSQKFGEGIVSVAHSNDLVSWAHSLLLEEASNSEISISADNEASPYSGGHPPLTLLAKAKSAMPGELELLSAFYAGVADNEIEALALDLGGMPSALLHSRYSVKSWLKNTYDLPLEVVPEKPNMDLFPLPMYEAGRMTNPSETASFEKWMLDNVDLCQDVAEFAPFASALRAGVPTSDSRASDSEVANAPQQTSKGFRFGITELTLAIGIAFVLISFFAFAFIVATSVD